MTITHPRTARESLCTACAAALARVAATAAAAFAWAERSQHRRLGFAFLPPEVLRDIRMSAEEATGLPSHRPDLPFFMQPGFERADR